MGRQFSTARKRARGRPGRAPAPIARPPAAAAAAAVGRLVTGPRVQPKLRIGAPDDAYEREADQVADRVMRMPEAAVQRTCAGCQEERLQRQPMEEEEEMLQTKPLLQRMCAECAEGLQRQPMEEEEEMLQTKPLLQRMCADCEEEQLQRQPMEEEEEMLQTRRAGTGVPGVAPETESEIRALSSGRPLATAERGFFEPRMGADLSAVRLHTGPRAERLAAAVDARAFTYGRDVVFGRGEYGSSGGRQLLAHELVHTVQQGASPGRDQERPGPHTTAVT